MENNLGRANMRPGKLYTAKNWCLEIFLVLFSLYFLLLSLCLLDLQFSLKFDNFVCFGSFQSGFLFWGGGVIYFEH